MVLAVLSALRRQCLCLQGLSMVVSFVTVAQCLLKQLRGGKRRSDSQPIGVYSTAYGLW